MDINRLFTLKKVMMTTLVVIAVALCCYVWHIYSTDAAPAAELAASQDKNRLRIPVRTHPTTLEDLPQYLNGLGTVTAVSTVTVRNRIEGELMALHFTEGQQVIAGQLLAEIDARPWQVKLMRATGQLAKDQATLANVRRDLRRFQRLAKNGLMSLKELDSKQAQVSEVLGSIQMDEGDVADAQLHLSYCRITAPVAGRVGLRQVDAGNYLSGSDTRGIVVITQTDPIDVMFSLPESSIAAILQARKEGATLQAEVWDRNHHLIRRGTLHSMDNQIDSGTATIRLKARFSNNDDRLFPHQFVNLRLRTGTLQQATVIPVAALQMDSEGHFVWLVNHEQTVTKQPVTVIMQNSEKVAIRAGLNAGDSVVTDGVEHLTEGAWVEAVIPPPPQPQSAHHADPSG